MPGPQDPSDQAADAYERGYDAARRADLSAAPADRPARGSLTELRQRLQRLPPGHPSSPYHDDGSRKPPVVRLKDLELPLSDEAGPGETEARAHGDGAESHGTYEADVQAGNPYAGEAKLTETDWAGLHQSETHATGNHRRETSLPEASLPQASLGETSEHETSEHETGEHETGEHETSQHETSQHETSQHETGEHETSERETGERETREHETDSAEADPHGTDRPDAAENAPDPPEDAVRKVATDPPSTQADGSWEWKGQRLKSGESKIAEQMLGRCRAAEGRTVFGTYGDTGLTPAMRRVEAQLEHGHLVPETEKFALKSADRFKEKLAKLIARNPDKSSSELAKEIHDSVRYTYIFEEEHYFDGVWQVHTALEDHGYELEVRRNTWDNPEYEGINTRWRDNDHDIRFEVQFHTPSSWDAKQRTHSAYERIADPRTSPGERAQLRSEQAKISATIPVPPRCEEIDDYRKEGH
jgi:hypothetical protein